MTWEDRDCPRCGVSPVRWDVGRDVGGVLALEMDNPTPFRCDGCGAEWVADTDTDGGRADA